jgi:NAD(P)-dependent dehydrogenase (short-subunit alcohol dehydrogenase family)
MNLSQDVYKSDLFAGQTALVTGGGTGIGLAIAEALGSLGANLLIASRNEDNLKAARDTLEQKTGRRVEYMVTNIRDWEAVQELYRHAEDSFGKLDVVVNNAGGQFAARFEDISVNGFRAVVETNLMGTFHSCKAATEHMKIRGGGRIINIVNDYCFDRGAPEFAHSGAARSGVVNLTYSLALEMAPYGIKANVLSPGLIASDAIDKYYGGEKYGDWLDRCKVTVPAQRFAEPAEVAAVVVFLASPAAEYLTGTALRLDGGAYLGNIEFAWPDAMRNGTLEQSGDLA